MLTAWNLFVSQAVTSVARTSAMIKADDVCNPVDPECTAICRDCGETVLVTDFCTTKTRGGTYTRYKCRPCRRIENNLSYLRRREAKREAIV